jgi:rhamnopyranosyl-N-acetylglucosaminyl-diphospho-decaprenol beta-1,3/1,4-galactofuranosyltransferase
MSDSKEKAEVSVKVCAVIVTRDRLALLQEAIEAVKSQSRSCAEIIVVNNDSQDGTTEWLNAQTSLCVFHQGNLGGAGGFSFGVSQAYERGHDWIWLMDDDTIPEPDALEQLLCAKTATDPHCGFLSSLVVWTDGTPHAMNCPELSNYQLWGHSVAEELSILCRSASFVSLLIHSRAVEACGLPIKDFFIWHDDAEYTRRISAQFACALVLTSRVLHKTKDNHTALLQDLNDSNAWKYKYGLRNQLYLLWRDNPSYWSALRAVRPLLFSITKTAFCNCSFSVARQVIAAALNGFFCFRPKTEFVTPHSS